MSADLERRRRAIADALRAVMAEPLPMRPPPPSPPAPGPVVSAPADPADATDADEVDRPVPPSVPPLEVVGGLSRTASRALFGHD